MAVVGDGGFQMCGMELATAVQERLPVVGVLVNDGSLTLIKAIQQRRYESRFIGVDLLNPDFGTFARAFGVPYRRRRRSDLRGGAARGPGRRRAGTDRGAARRRTLVKLSCDNRGRPCCLV